MSGFLELSKTLDIFIGPFARHEKDGSILPSSILSLRNGIYIAAHQKLSGDMDYSINICDVIQSVLEFDISMNVGNSDSSYINKVETCLEMESRALDEGRSYVSMPDLYPSCKITHEMRQKWSGIRSKIIQIRAELVKKGVLVQDISQEAPFGPIQFKVHCSQLHKYYQFMKHVYWIDQSMRQKTQDFFGGES